MAVPLSTGLETRLVACSLAPIPKTVDLNDRDCLAHNTHKRIYSLTLSVNCVFFGNARILCRSGSMKRYGVHPCVCPSMGPQQQTHCCRCCGPDRQETSIDCCRSGVRPATASSATLSAYFVSVSRQLNTNLLY